MIRNFTLKNSLGATFSLMNAQQGAYFNPKGLGFDDTTEYEQVGEFFAPLTQRFGQQIITGVMVFGAKPYESYLAFTKFCQHSPLSLIYETDAGAFQIPCRLTKIEKGDTDGWTYLECNVEFTALARMYKTVTANNTGTAGGGKVYLAKDLPDITGSIITIDNAEAGEVLNITADIVPVQSGSGTPSPTNVRPISGHTEVDVVRTGKNLLQNTSASKVASSVTWTVNDDGTVSTSGIASATTNLTVGAFTAKANVTYILSGLPSSVVSNEIFVRFHGPGQNDYTFQKAANYSNGGKIQFSFTSDTSGYVDVRIGNGQNANGLTFKPMICLATADNPTVFEPFGTTYTTPLGRTVYGGTLDLVSGELTVTHAKFKLSDCANGSYISGSQVFCFQFNSLNINTNRTATGVQGCISDTFANYYTGNSISLGSIPNGSFCVNLTAMSSGNSTITLKDTNYTTATDILNAYGNAVFVVPLTTPQTYQLTPQQVKTILGKNNIFANSGDITITGRKTYGYKYNYTYGDFVADTVTIDSDSVTASPCRISIFGECTNPTWRHYLDGNSVATGYYNGTIPAGHKLVIDTTSSPYSIEEQDISGNLIADRYELCDFSTERFFLLEYGHNTISVSHTDPDSIRLMVEGYIFYETV